MAVSESTYPQLARSLWAWKDAWGLDEPPEYASPISWSKLLSVEDHTTDCAVQHLNSQGGITSDFCRSVMQSGALYSAYKSGVAVQSCPSFCYPLGFGLMYCNNQNQLWVRQCPELWLCSKCAALVPDARFPRVIQLSSKYDSTIMHSSTSPIHWHWLNLHGGWGY